MGPAERRVGEKDSGLAVGVRPVPPPGHRSRERPPWERLNGHRPGSGPVSRRVQSVAVVFVVLLVSGCLQDWAAGEDEDPPGATPSPGTSPGSVFDEWSECRIRTGEGDLLECPRENVLEETQGFGPGWRCTGTFQEQVAYFWHEDSGLVGLAWNMTSWQDPPRVEFVVETDDVTYRYGRPDPRQDDAAVLPISLPEEGSVVIALRFLEPFVTTDNESLQEGEVGLQWFLHGTDSLPVYTLTRGDDVAWFPPDEPVADEWVRIERPYGTLTFDVRSMGIIDVAWSFADDEGDACEAFR